ncbi:MAG TPA: ATP-binding cassette domain-containing protein [Stellaceae bacterium]|nr:ATP-binding cassette domain-containing protein [Stellaceae bacterium]
MILHVDISRKRYRPDGPAILQDLRFSLDAGEIVALVGPSGCGKTTLLRLIAGLDRDYEGELAWAGAPRLGIAFQEPLLLPWRTVRENLALVERPDTPPGLSDELLAALGLAAEGNTFAARLSLGMARRVALARAFAVEPTLLLLDEPFVSLDEATASRGRELLLEVWARRPTSILLVTHDLAEATMLADRVLFLSGTPARIEREAVLPWEDRRQGTERAAALAASRRRTGFQTADTRDRG